MATEPDYRQIIAAVLNWPVQQRLNLMLAILETVDSAMQKKYSFSTLRGLCRREGPPPTDEEIRQWIDDYRTQKYGG